MSDKEQLSDNDEALAAIAIFRAGEPAQLTVMTETIKVELPPVLRSPAGLKTTKALARGLIMQEARVRHPGCLAVNPWRIHIDPPRYVTWADVAIIKMEKKA